MKKKITAALLVLLLLVQLIPVSVMAYPAPDYGPQGAVEKFESGQPMSVSHRSAWRMGPENSLVAIAASIDMGIDVVELDVKVTTDGVVVLSHDGTIDRCVMGSGSVEGYSWDALKTMPLKPGQGGSSAYTLTEKDAAMLNALPHYAEHVGQPAQVGGTMPITRLDDAVELIDKRCMINLDHCFNQQRFVACYTLFREMDMLNHVFFKNSASVADMNAWYEAAANAWNDAHPEEKITAKDVQKSILYVYISKSANDTNILQQHLDNGDNLVMVEIVIDNDQADREIRTKLEPWCLEHNLRLFINTMWSGLCSTKPDCETTWAEMIGRSYTAIQTDRPSELSCYLHHISGDRVAAEPVEAEHFHTFSWDDWGFSVPLACDGSMNKNVENIEAGDWMAYENIVFTGDEKMINVTAQGLYPGGQIQVYLDQKSAKNKIASLEISETSDLQVMSGEITGTVTAGKHTVYLEAVGTPDTPLLTMDRFQFVTGADLGGSVTIPPVAAVTEPGVAPVLPGTITALFDGKPYGLHVKWETMLPEDYAAEGTFVVLGYIDMLDVYVEAQVTVQGIPQEIPADGLALWLDAADAVTDADGKVTGWNVKKGEAAMTLGEGGSPVLRTVGSGKGLYFDGTDDYFDIVMDGDNTFWNEKSTFTVLMYTAAECTTNGATSGYESQKNSVMFFPDHGDWGSAYFTPSQNEVIFRFGSGIANDYGTAYTRAANLGSVCTATGIRKNGTEAAVYVDGRKDYTGSCQSATTNNIGSAGYVGRGKYNTFFQGTVCEILVYDRALTDEEIIGAQRAMQEKYKETVMAVEKVEVNCEAGKMPELPDAVTVTYDSGRTIQMGVTWEKPDPRDLAKAGTFTLGGVLTNGQKVTAQVTVTARPEITFEQLKQDLLLWFDAKDLQAAGPVAQWTAKVPGNSTVTAAQSTESAKPEAVAGADGAVESVRFDGNDVLSFSMEKDTFNGKSGLTAVIYSDPKMNAPTAINANHNNSVLYFGEYADWSGMYVGAYRNGAAGRFGTGVNGYRGVLYGSGNYDGSTTTVLVKDGKTIDTLYINGQKITDAVSAGSAAAETKYIDASKGMIGSGKNNTGWNGSVCEILVFDRALSDQELAAVYKHLGEDYSAGGQLPVPVTGVYLKEEGLRLDLRVGEQEQLTACTIPANADNKNLKWSSSDADVAAVGQNGLVTASAEGYAIITVETADGGFKASCTVEVKKAENANLWEDISRMLSWVEQNRKDSDMYSNWQDLENAASAAKKLSADSDTALLQAAYRNLRNAKLALTIKKLTVTFETGCSIKVEPVQVLYGQTISPVEIERYNYRLIGWYVNGAPYDFKTPVTKDLTLTAMWEYLGSTVPEYGAYLVQTAPSVHGSVTVSPTRADRGETVTITAVPDKGYRLETLTVTDSRGHVVSLTRRADGKYTFAMPGSHVTVTAAFVKDTGLPFLDVRATDWYYEAVTYVYDNKIMDGVGSGMFNPNGSMTRAMVWTVLARLDGVDTAGGAAWYTKAQEWAVKNGVSDGTMPDASVSREQLAAMLYRYHGAHAVSGQLTGYPDTDRVSDWAVEAMTWATGEGLINGMDGRLNPQGGATRAQMAAMLMRFAGIR